MDNFDLRKYLTEGRLFKEELDINKLDIASTITSIEDISDIRSVPTIRVNFNIDVPQDEENDLKDKVDNYLYSEYPDAEYMDWRDSGEVEIPLKSSPNKNQEQQRWSYKDGEITWLQPTNPENTLLDEEEGEIFTKGEFYENDILGRPSEDTQPIYGIKEENGTWSFSWDSGNISGFVEGEDFEF